MSGASNTLDEMCELIIDCPHFTPEWTNSGYLVIRNQNIRDGRLDLSERSYTHREDFERRIRRAKPRAGDIIFTREAPMGEVCLVPDGLECCVGQRQVLLRPARDVDHRYLFYTLRSPAVRHQIFWNEGTGSTVSNVRIPILKALKIPRMGHAETGIGELLGSIDDKIDLNRRMNETLEAMPQAIFRDWFVDFGPVRRKMAGATDPVAIMGGLTPDPARAGELAGLFPDAFGEEELPEGWRLRRVEDFMALAYGRSMPKTARRSGNVPVYGSGGIGGYHDEPLNAGPGIVVGRKGTVGTLFWEPGPFFAIDTVFYVLPKMGISLHFAWQLLQTLGLTDMNTDAAVPGLNRSNVYRLEVPGAPADVLLAFDKVAGPLRAMLDTKNLENRTLAETRDYLLPRLMSGEVRVTNASREIAA